MEHRDALTRCVAQGREPDGRWVSPTGKCMVRRQRHGHRRFVQARALGARVRPATRAGSGGRAGRRSRLAEGTWECHRAENIGAPPQQRHRGSNGRANWRARREDRPSTAWSNAERASHRGGVRRTVVERLERRTRTTQNGAGEHLHGWNGVSARRDPQRTGRRGRDGEWLRTGGAGGGGARPAETRHERLCTSACGASGWTRPAGTVGCRAAVRVLAACRRVSRGTRGGVGG